MFLRLGRHPPVSPISTTTASPSARVRRGASPAVHGIEGVVDEVGPHLVQLGGEGLDAGDEGVVVPYDGDLGGDAVREHRQGALQPLGQVGRLHGRPVELGVGLDGRDQVRDAPGGFLDLTQQGGRGKRADHPLQSRLERGLAGRLSDPFAPVDVGTRPARTGASTQGRPTDQADSQSERASSRSARSIGSTDGARGSSSLRSASIPVNCSALIGTAASRCREESSPSYASPRASTARVAAAAGLLSSCASPAARVPRAASASRRRAMDS